MVLLESAVRDAFQVGVGKQTSLDHFSCSFRWWASAQTEKDDVGDTRVNGGGTAVLRLWNWEQQGRSRRAEGGRGCKSKEFESLSFCLHVWWPTLQDEVWSGQSVNGNLTFPEITWLEVEETCSVVTECQVFLLRVLEIILPDVSNCLEYQTAH